MNRTKRLKMNTGTSLFTKVVTIVSGLIIPRLILSNFGVETHGLVSSIGQFLGIITFLDLGVGSVVKSSLYFPLIEKDDNQVSSILIAAKNYFQKIAYILFIYVIILIIFYPFFVSSTQDHLATAFLIIAMSIGQFGQYYFGIVNELLLSANQQDYIQLGSETVVVIFNLIVSLILINKGFPIGIVKLGSGLVYLIRPVYLSFYVNRNFNIDYNLEVKDDPLPQRWNGMGQHIAYSIQNGTDIVVLTFFSTLEYISIYTVYNMVISAIKLLVSSLTTSLSSFFGNLYAGNEIDLLNNYFDRIEWLVHTGVVYLYGLTLVLINPFVIIYTQTVRNISYEAPLFSLILVLAGVAYSLRSPYQSIIFSAGHFKQTQMSSYIEASLNIAISLILVNGFGLVGVALGTLISMTYRSLYLIIYLSKNIVFRPVKKFSKHIIVDFISMGTIFGMGIMMLNVYQIETLIDWAIVATLLGITSLISLYIINLIFCKDTMVSIVKSVLKKS